MKEDYDLIWIDRQQLWLLCVIPYQAKIVHSENVVSIDLVSWNSLWVYFVGVLATIFFHSWYCPAFHMLISQWFPTWDIPFSSMFSWTFFFSGKFEGKQNGISLHYFALFVIAHFPPLFYAKTSTHPYRKPSSMLSPLS